MAEENQLEVYRQRYEAFRHLDSLRWQMFQTAIASAGIVMALGKESIAASTSWLWVAIALIFMSLGTSMFRINYGVNSNNKMLKAAADVIGDDRIPVREFWFTGVSNWIAGSMVLVGLASLMHFIIG